MRRILVLAAVLLFVLTCPALADPRVSEVEAAVDVREFTRAVELLESMRTESPDDPTVWSLSARVELTFGNHARALEFAERAVASDDANADGHFTLGVAVATNLESMGAVGMVRGVRRMRRAWETAVALDPDHAEARLALVGFYAGAPRVLGGGAGKARTQVAELEKRDPVWGHRGRAMLHLIAEDTEAALREYDAALELVHEDALRASLHAERGTTCQNAEMWECAHESFVAAASLNPTMIRAHYQIGRTAVFSGERVEEGIEAFHRYLLETPVGSEPSLAWAHVRLASLYQVAGDDPQARHHLERALEISTEDDATAAAQEALAGLD